MRIGVGEGTKLLKNYVGLHKEYIAAFLIGEKRSAGDMDRELTEIERVAEISSLEISATLTTMLGILWLSSLGILGGEKGGVLMYKCAYKAAKRRKNS